MNFIQTSSKFLITKLETGENKNGVVLIEYLKKGSKQLNLFGSKNIEIICSEITIRNKKLVISSKPGFNLQKVFMYTYNLNSLIKNKTRITKSQQSPIFIYLFFIYRRYYKTNSL